MSILKTYALILSRLKTYRYALVLGKPFLKIKKPLLASLLIYKHRGGWGGLLLSMGD